MPVTTQASASAIGTPFFRVTGADSTFSCEGSEWLKVDLLLKVDLVLEYAINPCKLETSKIQGWKLQGRYEGEAKVSAWGTKPVVASWCLSGALPLAP